MDNENDEVSGRALGGVARAASLSPQRRAEIAKKAAESRWNNPNPPERREGKSVSVITYERPNGSGLDMAFEAASQELWATQDQIAELFERDKSVIAKHIKGVIEEGELEENSVVAKIAITAADGKRYQVLHYNLDMILSVGYRVSSAKATEFRKWATRTLKTYLEQGYVINEKALRESPEKLNKLAAEVRALRSSEKQVYAKVRECFKIAASDYDPGDAIVRKFYALLQDKFHHAVTGMTSSRLIMDRADHHVVNMGLLTMKGDKPTTEDATTGKNYLKQEELYRLHLLSEQFLLYAESTALAKRKMTMKSLHEQLDKLLTLNDYPVFLGYESFIKDEAISHAKRELGLYRKRIKIEALGMKYDEEALSLGEYDDILMEEA